MLAKTLCSQAAQQKYVLGGAQGTASSKKKKQAKLKRVMHTVKKQARRERADGAEGFAAIQLLHDSQVLQARFRGSYGLGICQNGEMPGIPQYRQLLVMHVRAACVWSWYVGCISWTLFATGRPRTSRPGCCDVYVVALSFALDHRGPVPDPCYFSGQ